MFVTNHAVGVGTCIQGMKIPKYLSSEMHLQNFSDHTKFQSWMVNFRAEVYAKARNKRKGAKLLRRAEDWKMDIVHMDTCAIFLLTHATGRRETVERSGQPPRRSHLEQVSSSVPKVKKQTDVKKLEQSKGQSCD